MVVIYLFPFLGYFYAALEVIKIILQQKINKIEPKLSGPSSTLKASLFSPPFPLFLHLRTPSQLPASFSVSVRINCTVSPVQISSLEWRIKAPRTLGVETHTD